MKSSSKPPSNKLFIRSEVLAVVNYLSAVAEPPREDRLKQLKRLGDIDDQSTVQKVLVKELQRSGSPRQLQAVTELLMELGDIEIVKDPLWQLIESPDTPDESKDAANLVLRQLGDQSDPNRYLDYLDDPEGLINRETERMLEVSTRNPEALIDFIDFIYSLPIEEQSNLINSLHEDYPPEYLVNIYIPMLMAKPPRDITALVLKNLGGTGSKRAALCFYDLMHQFRDDPELMKIIMRAVNELKSAGVYDETRFEEYRQELHVPHTIVGESVLYECFATIADGIGNQSIIVSRRRDNGDIAMMSVAVNDIHGIIDCFGFYALSEADFNKITEKFHEECSKIKASPEYCRHKLSGAEKLNLEQGIRLPYEYFCWRVLMDDVPEEPVDTISMSRQWANEGWAAQSANLYHHPDFATWFLEEGDHPVVTELLEDMAAFVCQEAAGDQIDQDAFLNRMDVLAEALIRGVLATDWRDRLIQRLADAAYLLHDQNAKTFCTLAATEVEKLCRYDPAQNYPLDGFIKQYGRRCVEEVLLRLKQSGRVPAQTVPLIDHVLTLWDI